VVIDTVARALLGADENSATDMGKFVKACDTIKEHTNAAVLGIHHSGKDGGKGMRGSSALLGAVDTSIAVKKSVDVITLSTEKQKDAEPADDMLFKMNVAEVGLIADESSVYLSKCSADEINANKASLNESQIKAMNCLRDATDKNGQINVGIARDSFNYWLAEKEELDPTDAKAKARLRMAWKRALDALLEANIVLFAVGQKTATWMQETNSSEQGANNE
jgi:RecA-family ATPase